jgi:hypothetical protein
MELEKGTETERTWIRKSTWTQERTWTLKDSDIGYWLKFYADIRHTVGLCPLHAGI